MTSEIKAVRSGDLDRERFDLISYPTVNVMIREIPDVQVDHNNLLHACLDETVGYLWGGELERLTHGWAYLALFIQKNAMGPENYGQWLDQIQVQHPWTAVPFYALQSLATVLCEGAKKYGEYNWMLGFPVESILNHAIKHLLKAINGISDEDDIGHAQCNLMMATHFHLYRPELCKNILGPNGTLTEEILRAMEARRTK